MHFGNYSYQGACKMNRRDFLKGATIDAVRSIAACADADDACADADESATTLADADLEAYDADEDDAEDDDAVAPGIIAFITVW